MTSRAFRITKDYVVVKMRELEALIENGYKPYAKLPEGQVYVKGSHKVLCDYKTNRILLEYDTATKDFKLPKKSYEGRK